MGLEKNPTVVLLLLLLLAAIFSGTLGDETTCMTDKEDGHNLHFICFCDSPRRVVLKHFQEDFFSLADFAYNLSGAFFAKSVFISFQSCRFLRLRLDQLELSRIGSPFFRPDIQVRGVSVEHVYHLDLNRFAPRSAEESDYLTFPSEDLMISTTAVALIGVERGAKFSNLITNSNNTELYINLEGARGDEPVNVVGFNPENIYFVTNTQEVPLEAVRENYKYKAAAIVLNIEFEIFTNSCSLVGTYLRALRAE